jgi:hypothetical protein
MKQASTANPSTEAIQTGIAGRALVNMSMLPPPKSHVPWRIVRQWYRNSLLRLLVSEGTASLHRMEWIRQIREVELLRGKDSVRAWMYEGGVSGAYRASCIDYMRYMENLPQWVSSFEDHLVSRAWQAGWASAIRNHETDKLQNLIDIQSSSEPSAIGKDTAL